MDKKLLSHDPFTGVSKIFHADDNDTFVIETEMAAPIVEEIIEANKANYNDAVGPWHNGKVVASIPIHIFWDLKKKGIADDDAAMKRWLNDPDNRYFRTRPGRV
jgi:hypothetical protein